MVGAGNFWDGECALWISPAQNGERVKQGQVLERGGRRIEVVEISGEGTDGVVRLKVSPSP
jgi:hypothetical protein